MDQPPNSDLIADDPLELELEPLEVDPDDELLLAPESVTEVAWTVPLDPLLP